MTDTNKHSHDCKYCIGNATCTKLNDLVSWLLVFVVTQRPCIELLAVRVHGMHKMLLTIFPESAINLRVDRSRKLKFPGRAPIITANFQCFYETVHCISTDKLMQLLLSVDSYICVPRSALSGGTAERLLSCLTAGCLPRPRAASLLCCYRYSWLLVLKDGHLLRLQQQENSTT
jgi:hypothetical protein